MAAELEYYKEQLAHGRHIELQRSTIAGIAAAGSGAIVGELLKRGVLTRQELPYTVTLFLLNALTGLTVAKLYERFRLHNEIAKLARNKLDPGLAALRREAEVAIKAEHPFLFWLGLHYLWNWTFGTLAVMGLVATVFILVH